MVVLYFQLFKPKQTSAKTDEKPEQFSHSKLPLDETVPNPNHQNKAVEITQKLKQTYHLERRTFL
ncbi:hypothetical protein K9N68_05255 [Kovacikia minuta CCNUW1]|uniref:hypothetical protein n=1 Tax=Kovacikia minuta TaxID=2931930 RepID=UPI001CC94D38|nr:hypothetical protein [Kovacikia minuta]UBF27368.1 hypothetical protein K9N68_05255 [Kovacikia minuta CCNUW1]